MRDPYLLYLLGGIAAALLLGTLAAVVTSYRATGEKALALAADLRARMRAWWIMVGAFAGALLLGRMATIVLFGLCSFLALREFITLTPTRRGDHRALFWAFFVITPLQYYLIVIDWYPVFAIFIPVYAFILIPIRIALAGDTTRYLERTAKIQWGLMVSVYFISHVPALLLLRIPDYAGTASLLLFLILIVQCNDVFQYVCGKLLGRTPIAPTVSPKKTVAGFVGGLALSTALGAALSVVTPFDVPVAAAMAGTAALLGFAGDLTMSAVKRDLGVKDYSSLLPGHGGVLDRFDSLAFAAPLFFHLTRYFYVA